MSKFNSAFNYLLTFHSVSELGHQWSSNKPYLDANQWVNPQPLLVQNIYHDHFWAPVYESFSERIASQVFVTAAQLSQVIAHELCQRALNGLGETLIIDGYLGPKTNEVLVKHQENDFLASYSFELKKHYQAIVAADPSQAIFLSEWLANAERLPA